MKLSPRIALTALGALALTHTASAAILIWNNAGGGNASAPSNWNPVQFPTGADQLIFALNSTYTVNFSGVPSSQMHSYAGGNVTLNPAGHTTINLLIADNNNNNATLKIGVGELSASVLRIADESTTTGTLNADSFLTDLNFGTAIVGNSGTATMNLSFGTQFSAGALTVANNADSSATVNVSVVPNFPPTQPYLFAGVGVIGNFGDAALNVFDGGFAEFAGHLLIGAQSGSTSTVTIDGPDASDLVVGGDLFIARNDAAAPAGTGTFLMKNDANVDVAGTTWVGDSNGSNGTLRLDGDGTFETGSLKCITNFSTLDLRNGHLIIDGGDIDPPGVSLLIDSPTDGQPLVELRNGATFTNGSFGNIQIGNGQFLLTSGSSVNITQPASVGSPAGVFGSLTVEDGSSLTVSSLGIGGTGDGAVFVNSNGTITTPGIGLGFASSTGFGTLDVMGNGALVNTDELNVGGDGIGTDGVGIVTVGEGGIINVNEPGFVNSVTIFPGGVIHMLDDGIMNIAANVSVLGQLNMLEGLISANSVSISGDLEGSGTVLANIILQTGGTISPGKDLLTVGDFNDNNGFNGNLGLLNVSDGSIRIRDNNGASLGATTIAGGTLDLFDGGLLPINRTLSGNGTIKGDLTNLGAITNSGGLGLRFLDGTLISENHTINGNRITFGPGSDFEGFGAIACSVIGEAGSEIIATGNLTMGNQLDPTGVSLGGSLNVGPHTVTMLDLADGVPLGTLTTINGGTLFQGIRVFLGVGDVLSGVGLIDSQLANNGGIIRPGGNNTIGTLNIDSAFTSGSGPVVGTLDLEVSGTNSVDNLVCASSAALDGTLNLKAINGFVPQLDQEFTVLAATSITGTFDSVQLQNAPSDLAATAIITATQVKVRIIPSPCPADISPPNGDNAVDVDDLLAVINGWGSCPVPPTACPADIAPQGGDGSINVDDLLGVINGWGTCD